MAATDTHATEEELLKAVFLVQSVPRQYNEGQLPLEHSPEPWDYGEKSRSFV
jgi:hypothetical protein